MGIANSSGSTTAVNPQANNADRLASAHAKAAASDYSSRAPAEGALTSR